MQDCEKEQRFVDATDDRDHKDLSSFEVSCCRTTVSQKTVENLKLLQVCLKENILIHPRPPSGAEPGREETRRCCFVSTYL